MSKSNPSDIKVAVPTPGAFAGLKSLNLQVFVMIAAIIVIMLFFTWMTDGSYLSARNVSNLLRQTAITGILAVGMVFVIISAEIDLSVGSMMGLLGGVAAIFDVWLGWPLPLTIAVTLVLGLRLVGGLPQSTVVYRHAGGNAGLPRHSDWDHQRHHRLPDQRLDVPDWPKLPL